MYISEGNYIVVIVIFLKTIRIIKKYCCYIHAHLQPEHYKRWFLE